MTSKRLLAAVTTGLALAASLVGPSKAEAATETVLMDNVNIWVASSGRMLAANSGNQAIQVRTGQHKFNVRPVNGATTRWHYIYDRNLNRCLTAPLGTTNNSVAIFVRCDWGSASGANRAARQQWQFIDAGPNWSVKISSRAYRDMALNNARFSQEDNTTISLYRLGNYITQVFIIGDCPNTCPIPDPD